MPGQVRNLGHQLVAWIAVLADIDLLIIILLLSWSQLKNQSWIDAQNLQGVE